jgi:hypothetical protein
MEVISCKFAVGASSENESKTFRISADRPTIRNICCILCQHSTITMIHLSLISIQSLQLLIISYTMNPVVQKNIKEVTQND